MATITDERGRHYQPFPYDLEAELESDVIRLADSIFGSSTIYVDLKKRMVGHDIIAVPDGYVIDCTDVAQPRLFVIENELAKHDPLKHVGIQLLRFATSFEDARHQVRRFLMEEIARDAASMEKLDRAAAESPMRNVDDYLDRAVYEKFRALVVIDEERPELHHVLGKINADISVLKLRRFRSEDGAQLHQFDTLYDEDEAIPSVGPIRDIPSTSAERRARRARADTIVVPAREEGFRRVFLGQDRWYSIRVGAAMKDRIRHIAAYQVAPVSAVTHVAEVQEIRPYEDTGKYEVVFRGPAREVTPIPIGDPNRAPQGPVYVEMDVLSKSANLEDALA